MKKENIIDNQYILRKIINKIKQKSVNSQAYLLNGASLSDLKKCSILLAKALICPNNFEEYCEKCNICKRINCNNYYELKIINPINNVIKKEQILNLKHDFNTNSLEGKNQVYIINEADLLNTSSANALLKFLEEPDSNTVAIFNSINIHNVIPTITSRCQIVNIFNNDKLTIDSLKILYDVNDDDINDTINFYKQIEKDHNYTLCNIGEILLNKYDTKDKLKKIMNILLIIYYDILNFNFSNSNLIFDSSDLNYEKSDSIVNKSIKKVIFILENIKKLKYNINSILFINNFLIGIGEINDVESYRN